MLKQLGTEILTYELEEFMIDESKKVLHVSYDSKRFD